MSGEGAEIPAQKQWTFGYDDFGNERLPAHLLAVSAHHARSAVSKSRSTDPFRWLDSAIHAGGAVELLAKCVLANVNPVLITDLKQIQDEGILQVLGLPTSESLDPRNVAKVSTKGPLPSIKLVTLLTGVNFAKDDIATVFNARNSAIHMGLMDRPELQRSLVSMVRLLEALLQISKVERRDYWGDAIQLIADLDDQVDLHRTLRGKLEYARRQGIALEALREMPDVADLFQRSTQREFDFASLSEQYEIEVNQKCPACVDDGVIFCEISDGSLSSAHGYDPYIEVVACGIEYACDSCGLRLNIQEMGQLGISENRVVDWRLATEEEIETLEQAAVDAKIQDEIDWLRGR